MGLTDPGFYVCFAVTLIIYYFLPSGTQWMGLMTFSVLFIWLTASWKKLVLFLVLVLFNHFCALVIRRLRNGAMSKRAGAVYFAGICADFLSIFLLRDQEHFALLGISFFGLQLISYLTDSYWEVVNPQINPGKTILFAGYYPLLFSGPIVRYGEMSSLYESHSFDWNETAFGMQRILWGLIKKIVISARLAVIVNTIYNEPERYVGLYIWIAAALFMMQLYMDFSGCMDIVIGVSQCYGIRLPENFKTPFLSQTVQEFWQRWHVTLGSWARDYIMYPFLRTSGVRAVTGYLRGRLKVSKTGAKHICSYFAMLPVWLFVGVWHGNAPKYAIGMGLWFWVCIVLENILSAPAERIETRLGFRTDAFSWRLFRRVRTFILVAVGNMFFRLPTIKETFHVLRLGVSEFNPWIFFDGSLFELGLSRNNVLIMLLFLCLALYISYADQEDCVRSRIARQGILFRQCIYVFLIWSVLVFGMYGPGYQISDFIYEQF